MTLRKDIEKAMLSETATPYNTRLANIADMAGASEDDVRERMKSLDFPDYVNLMRSLRDRDEQAIKELLGLVREAYSAGGTVSPSEMRANKTSAPSAADAVDKASQGKTLSPIQRKAMAAQASSVDKLASDPRTATQFRNLLNKINK
jgi:hypothetical protein